MDILGCGRRLGDVPQHLRGGVQLDEANDDVIGEVVVKRRQPQRRRRRPIESSDTFALQPPGKVTSKPGKSSKSSG